MNIHRVRNTYGLNYIARGDYIKAHNLPEKSEADIFMLPCVVSGLGDFYFSTTHVNVG